MIRLHFCISSELTAGAMAATFAQSAESKAEIWSSCTSVCRLHASITPPRPRPWKRIPLCARIQLAPPFRGPRDSASTRSQRRLCIAMASTVDIASIREQHGAVGKYLQSLGARTTPWLLLPANRARQPLLCSLLRTCDVHILSCAALRMGPGVGGLAAGEGTEGRAACDRRLMRSSGEPIPHNCDAPNTTEQRRQWT